MLNPGFTTKVERATELLILTLIGLVTKVEMGLTTNVERTPELLIFTLIGFVTKVERVTKLLRFMLNPGLTRNVERAIELLILTLIGFVTKVEIGLTTKLEIPGFIMRVENTDGLLIQTGTQLFVINVDNTADELLMFILKPGFIT